MLYQGGVYRKRFAHWLKLHAEFFQNQYFPTILSGIPSECQTVWIKIRRDVFTGPDPGSNCLQMLSADDTSNSI